MNYTEYDTTTGQILGILHVPDDQLPADLDQKPWIEGHWDTNKYYVDQGEIKELTPNPSHDHVIYDLDWSTKTWQINLIGTGRMARQTRDAWLQSLTRMNPMWYASLTAEQQQQLQTYRQALLDVPQQPGFPLSVEWPAKPTWL